jgi:hypothetical protein
MDADDPARLRVADALSDQAHELLLLLDLGPGLPRPSTIPHPNLHTEPVLRRSLESAPSFSGYRAHQQNPRGVATIRNDRASLTRSVANSARRRSGRSPMSDLDRLVAEERARVAADGAYTAAASEQREA